MQFNFNYAPYKQLVDFFVRSINCIVHLTSHFHVSTTSTILKGCSSYKIAFKVSMKFTILSIIRNFPKRKTVFCNLFCRCMLRRFIYKDFQVCMSGRIGTFQYLLSLTITNMIVRGPFLTVNINAAISFFVNAS